MSFWIPLIFLFLSVVVLATVFLSRLGWDVLDIDDEYVYPVGYVATGLIGVSAGFLGFDLLRSESQVLGMVGGFLLLSGLQVTLWLLGVRFEFLGNQSTVEETSSFRRGIERPLFSRHRWLSVREREYLLERKSDHLFEFLRGTEELPELDSETLHELAFVLKHPDLRPELTPFAKEVLTAAEEFRLEARISGGERGVEAHRKLIRAISRFRVELAFWPYG